MSTQLILYPQYYNGFDSINFTANEFVVDGINFNTINGSTSYTTGGSIDSHLTATPPAQINTWYRWRSTSGGTPAFPVTSGTNLVLNAVAPYSISGVYQKLSSLIVGASYTLTVNMTPEVGSVNLKAYNITTNSLIGNSGLVTSNTTQQTLTFTAQTTNDAVAILYFNAGATDLTISSISLSPTGQAPTQVYADLIDGQVICDLYAEEDIPLTLSIDDFKNVAEKVQSYSKDFNLPATKRNNRIFNNMFEVTRSVGNSGLIFNPYVRTKCVLKQDGFILFEGYLRLIDVKDKEGEISYNVNLYSDVIALADILKDSTFSDLDFTELTHDYNIGNILHSWNNSPDTSITYTEPSTSGFRNAYTTLRYPYIDWNHQFSADPTTGSPNLPNLESAFRPCIQLKYLISRIFAASGFNFTSNFFDSADFEKLYMDFNWGSNEFGSEPELGTYGGVSLTPIYSTTSYQTVPLDNENFSSDIGWSSVNNRFTATNPNSTYSIEWMMTGTVLSGMGNLTVRWAKYNSGGTFLQQYDYSSTTYATGLAIPTVSGQIDALLQSGDYLQLEFKTDVASKFVITLTGPLTYFIVTIGSLVATTSTFLQTLRGELGQWDFLKGIMTMFNLVSMVDESNPDNILIEPYADIFINNTRSNDLNDQSLSSRFDGKIHDWTEKIDASEMELKPLTDLNKNTIFQFVEDEDDYAFKVFKNAQSGHLYGSKEYDASGFTILEGTEEIIAEPFAATVSKPLMPQFPEFVVPSLYAMTDDGTAEGFDNSPRIFYNNGEKTLTSCSPYIPAQNGSADYYLDTFLQFSHLSDVPTIVSSPPASTDTRDFVFASEQLISGLGQPPTDNLYSVYWQPYFNELYSPDTRIMKLKVNLTPADISTFKFYDVVMIKNRTFRVNKIEYKPNTLAKVEFILIP